MNRAGAFQRGRGRSAFTLLEIVVVLALVAVLAGIVGVALRGNSSGSAVLSAQRQMAGLVSAGRAHAALSQVEVRLLVCADASAEGTLSLRALRFVRAERATWGELGGIVELPAGTAVVPPVGVAVSGEHWPATAWNGPVDLGLAAAEWRSVYFLRFLPDGRVLGRAGCGPSLLLAVAPIRRSGAALAFEGPASALGLLVQPSGGVTFLEDASVE